MAYSGEKIALILQLVCKFKISINVSFHNIQIYSINKNI